MQVASAFQFDDEPRLVALANALNAVPADRLSGRIDRMFAYLAAGHGPVSEAEDVEALRRRRARPDALVAHDGSRALVVLADIRRGEDGPGAAAQPTAPEALLRLLLRGAVAGKVDLDSWISVDAFLITEGVAADDLNHLTEADLAEVRRRLHRRGTLLDMAETAIERMDEQGLITPALTVTIIVAVLFLAHALSGQALAADEAQAGPAPSSLAGLLVAFLPIVIACLFAAYALCGTAPVNEDEAIGDTTGFGERD